MQQSLNQYLLRVGFFLALVFIIIVLLYPVLQNAFLSNIFIKKGSNLLDWSQVAPFDLIVIFKSYTSLPHQYLDLLAKDGLLFFTKENKDKVSIMKCNKDKKIQKLKVKDFYLEENIIL